MHGAIEIEVLEETPDRAYLVIPSNRIALSDEQLDVAGGAVSIYDGPESS